jgi:hypothetical protein
VEIIEFAVEPVPEPFIKFAPGIGATTYTRIRRIVARIPRSHSLDVLCLFEITQQKTVACRATVQTSKTLDTIFSGLVHRFPVTILDTGREIIRKLSVIDLAECFLSLAAQFVPLFQIVPGCIAEKTRRCFYQLFPARAARLEHKATTHLRHIDITYRLAVRVQSHEIAETTIIRYRTVSRNDYGIVSFQLVKGIDRVGLEKNLIIHLNAPQITCLHPDEKLFFDLSFIIFWECSYDIATRKEYVFNSFSGPYMREVGFKFFILIESDQVGRAIIQMWIKNRTIFCQFFYKIQQII